MQLIHQIVTILLSDSDTTQVLVATVRSPEHAVGTLALLINNLEQVERLITLTQER